MAATDIRTMWQRTASNRSQEDSLCAPKLAHCPILPTTQPKICHPEMVQGVDYTPSYYRTNSWGSLDSKTVWQSPTAQSDYRSEYLAMDELFGSQCMKHVGLQALAAKKSINMKSCNPGAKLEFEWQLIVDPKPKFGLLSSIQAAEVKEITVDLDHRSNEEENKPAIEDSLHKEIPMRASLMTKNSPEAREICTNSIMQQGEPEAITGWKQFQECVEKCQQIQGHPCFGGQSIQCMAPTPSPMASSVSWRTANKEALAALVAQKATERLENCDLPTPLSKSVLKAPLESYDLVVETQSDISNKLDKNPLASILQVGEPSRPDNHGLPAFPILLGRSETMISPSYQYTKISQPLTIPTTGHASSTARHHGCHSFSNGDNGNTSWNRGCEVTCSSPIKSSGPLGEALCHSQTRAREAEKRAERSFQEYQKISHLFFQEASLSLTYRQLVSSLQAENTRLRMYAQHQQTAIWLQQSIFSPFIGFERFSNNRWRNYGIEHVRRQMREHFSASWPKKESIANFVISGHEEGAGIIMGSTLSFAFALGLNLAGAGLMLGWSMGWILLAC